MRRHSVLALIFFSLLVRAADAPETAAMRLIRPEAIRAHMTFLADDLLEGRGSGTRGYDLAGRYIAAEFEQLGLEPAGVEHTYYQPVPLRQVQVVAEASTAALTRDGHEEVLVNEKDCVISGSPLYLDTTVKAPVVFVGFGVNAPEIGYNDYAGVDVKGKIVAVFYGAPPKLPSSERAHYSSNQVKAEEAVAHGAVGIIVLWVGALEKETPFPRLIALTRTPSFRWIDAAGNPNYTYPQIRGAMVVGTEAGRKMFAEAPISLEHAMADANASKSQAFPLPISISIHTVTRHASVKSSNIVAVLRGSDATLRSEFVVFTAHADHLGIGRPVDGDSIYNGALDNASGVAGLLEIARAFTRLPEPPRRSILFAAVTGEEAGLVGSDYFARNPTVPAKSMVADINLDGLSLFYDFRDVIAFGEEHSSLGKVVRETANRMDLQVSPDPLPQQSFFIRSDQYSFVRQGIPAMMIFPGLKAVDPKVNGMQVVMSWMGKVYHTPKDDMNQPLNFNAAARHTQLDFLIGYMVAQADERPTWNSGDFFGKKFATR